MSISVAPPAENPAVIAGCPWDSWRQAPLQFCEEPLCSWIKQPANTISSAGFVAAGIWIWARAPRRGASRSKAIAAIAIATGLGSAFYHASGTYWGSLADYAGMFMTSALMVALNAERWLAWGPRATAAAFLGAMLAAPGSERWLFAIGSPCWLIEVRLYFRDRHSTRHRALVVGYVVIGVAALFWWLDVARVLCNPKNHVVTGHSVWHLLLAASFLAFHRFYAQFPVPRAASASSRTDPRFDE